MATDVTEHTDVDTTALNTPTIELAEIEAADFKTPITVITEVIEIAPYQQPPELEEFRPTHRNYYNHEESGSGSESGYLTPLPTLPSGAATPSPLLPGDPAVEPFNSLPPVDGGLHAWIVLCACFVLEAITWGFPFSFGVFQEYYSGHLPFSKNASGIAIVGTTATGVLYFLAPLVYLAVRWHPSWRHVFSFFGQVMIFSSLIGASFATSNTQLLASQGILYGLGAAVTYYPVFGVMDEWWVARKGFAFGVMFCAAGTSGTIIPFAMQAALQSWGYAWALRCWAFVNLALAIPSIYLIRSRLPIQHGFTGPRHMDWTFLKSRAFWILQAGNVVQGLGYFIPTLYLPSFAKDAGFSAIDGTAAIALINAANVGGTLIAGRLVDHTHVTNAIAYCAMGNVISVLLFWTFATVRPMLYVFAISYGLTAGGYVGTWAGVLHPVRQKYPAVENGMILAFFSAGKGLGAVVAGPLSTALVTSDTWKGHVGYGFGSGYGYLILFSGLTATLAMLSWVAKRCSLI